MLNYDECVALKEFMACLDIKTECYLESNKTTRIRIRNNCLVNLR